MIHKMNFEVRDEQAETMLKEIGKILKECCPKGYGFNLLVFTFGEGGNMFYCSNAQREDMIRAMQEFIAKIVAAPRDLKCCECSKSVLAGELIEEATWMDESEYEDVERDEDGELIERTPKESIYT